ncbi:MAG: hypothetical protein ACKVWV_15830 [Planctomycetota bacterium]
MTLSLITSSKKCAMLSAFVLALTGAAFAGNISVSGAGGPIPDHTGTPDPGTWNAAPTWSTFTSTINVPVALTSVTSVNLSAFTHTWKGDLHVYLQNPAGTRFNLLVRAGFTGAGFGNSGNYNLGNYTIVESGGSLVTPPTTDLAPGTYNQFLNTGGGQWTSGSFLISNTLLSSISGPAGNWTLHGVDWGSFDTGSIGGWTLNGTAAEVTSFCFGDGSGTACPCANGGAGEGCANSGGSGATLVASGTVSIGANNLVLTASGMMPGSFCIFRQGTGQQAGGLGVLSPGTDGLDCIGGTVLRIGRIGTLGGTASTTNIVVQGGIAAPGVFHYQGIYRNQTNFCTPATLNGTNGVTICWKL